MGNFSSSKPNPKRKYEAPLPTDIGKRRKIRKYRSQSEVLENQCRIPKVSPIVPNKLRLIKMNRIKDHLILEEEFLKNVQLWYNKPTGDVNNKKIISNRKFSETSFPPISSPSIIGPSRHTSDILYEDDRDYDNDEEEDIMSFDPEIEITLRTMEKLRGMPMRTGKFVEMIDENHAIVETPFGDMYLPVLSIVDKSLIEPESTLLLNAPVTAVVGIIHDPNQEIILNRFTVDKSPLESFNDIGGYYTEIEEIKEAVVYPLINPELYVNMGIEPPKGIILYGPPGNGKTLIARAVANHTKATFLKISGSELVQKSSGSGSKLIRNLFEVAQDYSPTIVFIDEIDAIGCKRTDTAVNISSGEKEVQRTMLELLNQLDGFDRKTDIKVILATNRIESLDSALIRPGRIDRKIFIDYPDDEQKLNIFEIHSRKMNLSRNVDPANLLIGIKEISSADIKAICMEAGLRALRDKRIMITEDDLMFARNEVIYRIENNSVDGLYL